ncbi:hypothetical protein [Mariniflexile sp. AS56]|uniref:hypothetical protein n=1 Tax=Mariniflexile sp. AS56 TaxID=3063957 RepID=UPI0026F04181|nr:hypothetical protein [Mariniflexile sp. AS56]MDO7174115.1 hypothetical protein [Mariniflexile sp. AS56]
MKNITFLSLLVFSMTLQAQTKLLSSTEEYNDGTSWKLISGYNYEYDASANLISETQFNYNSTTGNWENAYKYMYTYNANNKATLELGQDWNSITSQFEDSYRTHYNYNGNGDITEIIDQFWENSTWKND